LKLLNVISNPTETCKGAPYQGSEDFDASYFCILFLFFILFNFYSFAYFS